MEVQGAAVVIEEDVVPTLVADEVVVVRLVVVVDVNVGVAAVIDVELPEGQVKQLAS